MNARGAVSAACDDDDTAFVVRPPLENVPVMSVLRTASLSLVHPPFEEDKKPPPVKCRP